MAASTYFFNNETKNECVYVKNTGTYTMEIENVISQVCEMKKWDKNDKVIIMIMDSQTMTRYIYQNGRFDICFKEDSKYDMIEIETDKNDIVNDCGCCSEEDVDLYDEDYDFDEDYDDRYDERDDDGGFSYGGYEDEFYESCDIY